MATSYCKAVMMSVSDSKRQLTVTEPMGNVASKMMALLKNKILNHIAAINRLLGLPKGTVSLTHLKALSKTESNEHQAV